MTAAAAATVLAAATCAYALPKLAAAAGTNVCSSGGLVVFFGCFTKE
jgi:hypothetical protein